MKSRWFTRTLQNDFDAAASHYLVAKKGPHLQGYRGKHIWYSCNTTKGLIQLFP